MKLDICKERYLLRQHYGPCYGPNSDEAWERLAELNRLWKELPVEEVEIHQYGGARIYDCPAHERLRKLFPIKDVYGDAGCTSCAYHAGVYLQHVRCKWRAAREALWKEVGVADD